MSYIIVVDGGGTKTKGRSYDLDGKLIKEHIEDFSNPMVDLVLSVNHIVEVLLALTLESKPEAVILGIAGCAQTSVHEVLYEFIKVQTRPFLEDVHMILVDDLTLSYYATFGGEEGLLGILGTGSALLTRIGSDWLRMGGYGHIIGDEGSGYVLAAETVKEAIWRLYNGNTSLSEKITDYFSLETLEDIKTVVYRTPKSALASLSLKVFEWEREECLTPIIEKQIKAFSEMTLMMIRKRYTVKGEKHRANLSLMGGMVQKNSQYFARMKANIHQLAEQEGLIELDISSSQEEACRGGLYLYHKYQKQI